jgi:DNA (cytosine-5)-methyltransferase 3A
MEMKILSLFDGMACGYIAMLGAGVEVDRYVAFEIDKYAVKTSSHNFPNIEHKGDVFDADFTEYQDFDFLVGGSPCTYWSIAQKNGRETEASGMGWELFQQYVRALHEAKPKYYIYENNKSMSKAIRASIDEAFGFEAVLINSALVSAQNRQRLYWVGKRNADGTYSKVSVEQPVDRGILLKDVLESDTWKLKHNAPPYGQNLVLDDESWEIIKRCAKHLESAWGGERVPPYGTVDKARPLNAHYPNNCGGFEHRMFSDNPNKQQVDMIVEPVNATADGKSQTIKAQYQQNNDAGGTFGASGVAEPIRVGALPRPNGELSTSQAMRIYSTDGKSVNLTSGGGGMGGKTGLYAIPVEFDGTVPTKAISQADGKTYRVHKVENGIINIKGKDYPIKLADGYYIIRKLTVRECMRLQTIPEWYEFPASDAQAYKQIGNGWTCEVITHLIKSCLAGKVDDFAEQIKFF